MKRVIIAGTIAFLVVVILNTMVTQDSLLQLFASNDTALQIVRVVIIGLLLALLLIAQPRSIYLRAVLGGASVFLVIGSVHLLLQYLIGMLDVLLFMQVAIIFAIEALESPEAAKNFKKKTLVISTSINKVNA